jgi:hypothetical protein
MLAVKHTATSMKWRLPMRRKLKSPLFGDFMPTLHKQIIMKAFPSVNQDGETWEENIEPMILKYISVADHFFDQEPVGTTKTFRDSVVLT